MTIPWTTSAKSALTLVGYRNATATLAPGSIASSADNSSITHTAPTVTAPSGAWLLTYWSDKSSWTSAWTTPASDARRALALGTGERPDHVGDDRLRGSGPHTGDLGRQGGDDDAGQHAGRQLDDRAEPGALDPAVEPDPVEPLASG